ncbi:MAG: Glu/Leu/Phe/Val dehydrogenase [Planctomycetes bacterium]|nr:Glu/Leu/Phe/Val dehydrogenase [Planctomycetota bacterium]
MVNNNSHSSKNQHSPNSVFEASATYCMALSQLESVGALLKIDRGILQRLSVPKRAMIVSVPVRMDDGSTRVFNGYRVQHSLTSGPSKGGLRYHHSVDLGEVAALSMWMSWKCGIMNLPFGGAKGGINCDPETLSVGEKERLTRRFTEEVLSIIGPRMDVMAPDMGTDEQTMAWIMDTYSMKVGYACPEIVTGKPVELGGCLGRKEATGRGVTYCVLEALKDLNIKPEEATAVVQGFGNVGAVTCAELSRNGIKVIAVSDRYGAIHNASGIDIAELQNFVSGGNLLKDFPKAKKIDPEEMLILPCTVLVPAALERVIHLENAAQLKCKILAEAANGPTTPEADAIISRSDIYVIPDILCNAGGVTVSYFEWVQDIQQLLWSEEQVNHKLYELMIKAFKRVRDLALSKKISMRLAALSLGMEKIAREKIKRGLFP